jgi:serine/threonine-protein kinase
MNAELWEKIAELYHAASDLPPDQQDAFLDEACSGDQELRREVKSLLRQDVAGDGLLERVAEEAAPRQSTLPRAIGRYRILSLVGERRL